MAEPDPKFGARMRNEALEYRNAAFDGFVQRVIEQVQQAARGGALRVHVPVMWETDKMRLREALEGWGLATDFEPHPTSPDTCSAVVRWC